MQPWEVDARECIRDLTTRYNSNGDSGRFNEVRALFHDDAEMHLEGRPYIGIDEVMTIFTGTQDQLNATDAPPLLRHFTATHQIDLIDSDHARGRLYFYVFTAIGADHWGTYMDHYRRGVDGNWRFARRSVKVEGRASNSVFTTS
jgi:SnoaL-like domain